MFRSKGRRKYYPSFGLYHLPYLVIKSATDFVSIFALFKINPNFLPGFSLCALLQKLPEVIFGIP